MSVYATIPSYATHILDGCNSSILYVGLVLVQIRPVCNFQVPLSVLVPLDLFSMFRWKCENILSHSGRFMLWWNLFQGCSSMCLNTILSLIPLVWLDRLQRLHRTNDHLALNIKYCQEHWIILFGQNFIYNPFLLIHNHWLHFKSREQLCALESHALVKRWKRGVGCIVGNINGVHWPRLIFYVTTQSLISCYSVSSWFFEEASYHFVDLPGRIRHDDEIANEWPEKEGWW